MHLPPRARRDQRGNILFIILLAVALFAALNYAATSSMRGGGKEGMAEEAAKAAASELLNYGALVNNTLMRMSFDTKPTYIDLADPNGSAKNQSCTSNTCRLFKPDGGAIARKVLDNKYKLDPSKGGWISFRMIKVEGIGTDKPEIALFVTGVKKEICQAVNKISGIIISDYILYGEGSYEGSILGFSPGEAPHTAAQLESDTFFNHAIVGTSTYSPQAAGRTSFCVCTWSSASACDNFMASLPEWKYRIWYVVLPR
jgi:hypothetical protein